MILYIKNHAASSISQWQQGPHEMLGPRLKHRVDSNAAKHLLENDFWWMAGPHDIK